MRKTPVLEPDISNILPPALYIVATPIGDPNDLSDRAKRILRDCDLILSEDTRITRQLLKKFDIKTRLISFNANSENGKAPWALELISKGHALALVSDAGTPGISDPGRKVVDLALNQQINVISIPGPSALTAALSVSGFPASRSLFIGFLPTRRSARVESLRKALAHEGTLILFEAPHRIPDLASSLDKMADGRKIAIVKELTKQFEYLVRLEAGHFQDWIEENPDRIRGEFVVLIGPRSIKKPQMDLDVDHLLIVLGRELPPSKAAAICSEITGLSKKTLYQKLTASSNR